MSRDPQKFGQTETKKIKNKSEDIRMHAQDIDRTMTFSVGAQSEEDTKQILITVYEALLEKGYNPINQIVGYLLSEDPTYITSYKNARALIRKIDRDELMNTMVKKYLGI